MNAGRSTIKSKMRLMVMMAIIVPFIYLLGFTMLYQKQVLEVKQKDEIEAQVAFNTEILTERLNSIIARSRVITYEKKVETINDGYVNGSIKPNLCYSRMMMELKNNFYFHRDILFSAIILDENPDQIYSVTKDGHNGIGRFASNLEPKLDEITKDLGNQVAFFHDNDNVYIIRNLISVDNYKKFGVIINKVNTSFLFEEFLSDEDLSTYTTFEIGGSTFDFQDREKEELKDNKNFKIELKLHELDYELLCTVNIPQKSLVGEEKILLTYLFLGVTLTLMILFVLLCKLYRSITRPLEELVKAFKLMELGAVGVTIPYDEKEELAFLIKGFNDMSKGSEYLVHRVYQEELKQKEMKIQALQNQINPHFVNNTLEIINWKVQKLGGFDISKMLRNLSVIMCAYTNRDDDKVVALAEEMHYVESYLYIIERRFEDKITIIKEIDEKLLYSKIPLLVIQPLLENAISYGIEPNKGGCIEIHISQKDFKIYIEIINDGKQLTEEKEAYIKEYLKETTDTLKRGKVGIYNVNQRLQLIYGSDYGLRVYRNKEGKTVSEVRIPIE